MKKKKILPLKDAFTANALVIQAIADLLQEKGILTKEEITAKIQELKREMESAADGFTVSDN